MSKYLKYRAGGDPSSVEVSGGPRKRAGEVETVWGRLELVGELDSGESAGPLVVKWEAGTAPR